METAIASRGPRNFHVPADRDTLLDRKFVAWFLFRTAFSPDSEKFVARGESIRTESIGSLLLSRQEDVERAFNGVDESVNDRLPLADTHFADRKEKTSLIDSNAATEAHGETWARLNARSFFC